MLPVPDHPAVIECRRSIGILEPSDALGQHDFFGKHRTVDEQMPSASRVVEVRAQEHCDYASVVKAQGAFDELPRQSIGWIGDDRVDTRLRCLSQEVHALSDVASDHVETSLLERRDHLAAAACWLPNFAGELWQMRDQCSRYPCRRFVLVE